MEDYRTYQIVIPEEFAEVIESKISSQQHVTHIIPSLFNPSKTNIALFSIDDEEIHSACIMKRSTQVVTGAVRVKLKHFVKFKSPIKISEIHAHWEDKDALPYTGKMRNQIFLKKEWDKLFKIIKTLREENRKKLDRLEEIATRSIYEGAYEDIISFGRDALSIILRLSKIGFDSDKVTVENNNFEKKFIPNSINNAVHITTAKAIPNKQDVLNKKEIKHHPLFFNAKDISVLEDQMLVNDSDIFKDWEKVSKSIIGKVTFQKGNHKVEVLNVNRTKVENSIGVDLIYYNLTYGSFVMIQYKRMKDENGQWIYRPERNFDAELKRMNEFTKKLLAETETNKRMNYRINDNPFYWKFCQSRVIDFEDVDLVKGMYLPLDYVNIIESDEGSKGVNGGRIYSYHNVQRHFNNTEFIDLVEKGWIGSSQVNKEMIINLIENSLKGKKQVILAEYSVK